MKVKKVKAVFVSWAQIVTKTPVSGSPEAPFYRFKKSTLAWNSSKLLTDGSPGLFIFKVGGLPKPLGFFCR
jgi:hypothetical protein